MSKKRAAVVEIPPARSIHISRRTFTTPRTKTFCGRAAAAVAIAVENTGEANCARCVALFQRWFRTESIRYLMSLGARRNRIEQRAKAAYRIWEHALPGCCREPWERLPEPERESWREVVQYIADAIEDDAIDERAEASR